MAFLVHTIQVRFNMLLGGEVVPGQIALAHRNFGKIISAGSLKQGPKMVRSGVPLKHAETRPFRPASFKCAPSAPPQSSSGGCAPISGC